MRAISTLPSRISCHSAKTVRLPGVEVYVCNLAGKGTEDFRQKIGRGNGGNGQVNDFLFCPVNSSIIFAHVQHIGSAVVKLQSSLCDSQLLGGADQQTRVQFLLQRIDVGTDGGLGQVQLAGGFGEAFIFDYGYEGL